MAVREAKRDVILNEISSKLYSVIRAMEDGSKASIGKLVSQLLSSRGYTYQSLDGINGHGWTKDDCKTFILNEMDLFDVLDKTESALYGDVSLDFSNYQDMIVGLPYNMQFTVRQLRKA